MHMCDESTAAGWSFRHAGSGCRLREPARLCGGGGVRNPDLLIDVDPSVVQLVRPAGLPGPMNRPEVVFGVQ